MADSPPDLAVCSASRQTTSGVWPASIEGSQCESRSRESFSKRARLPRRNRARDCNLHRVPNRASRHAPSAESDAPNAFPGPSSASAPHRRCSGRSAIPSPRRSHGRFAASPAEISASSSNDGSGKSSAVRENRACRSRVRSCECALRRHQAPRSFPRLADNSISMGPGNRRPIHAPGPDISALCGCVLTIVARHWGPGSNIALPNNHYHSRL